MTRRGSLAYYLAAWVCGCFFMSATIWLESLSLPTEHSVSGLLFVYFLELMNGALPSLLFGFLLRRAANGMHWSRAWQWLTCGAILAPAMTALLGRLASVNAFEGSSGWRNWISVSLLASPAYAKAHWVGVLTAPAGAATAWVLFRVDRAFGRPANETNS
jgi:hypothetical protein